MLPDTPYPAASPAPFPHPESPHPLELLAPAGSRKALEAAIAAGADAVYLGAPTLNARRNAANFTLPDISRAAADAHLRHVRVYLAANTLVLPGEMTDALRTVSDAAEAGVDAAIVADIGLASRLHTELPALELHASTQMNIRDESGIDLAAALGFSRVTLARELSVSRVAELACYAARRHNIEIECFVHGALCICQSGQCLFSSMVGGRSANRGLCAQPCRLPYTLVDSDGEPLSNATGGEHLLSTADLCGLDHLADLASAGVASLKIEGRMKSADYVSTTTAVYRSALDALAAGSPPAPDSKALLAEAFSRGFTSGYLDGNPGPALMSTARPNNRGVPLGRVRTLSGTRATVELSRQFIDSGAPPPAAGDILEIWTSRGRITHTVSPDELPPDAPEAPAMLDLDISGRTSPGDRVFRVRSAALARSVAARTESGWKVPVHFQVTVHEGEPLAIQVTLAYDESAYDEPAYAPSAPSPDTGGGGSPQANRTATAYGPTVEPARTKAITADEIREHVGRLGATPFTCEAWQIDLDEGVGLPYSALHKTRAAALDELAAAAEPPAPVPGKLAIAPEPPVPPAPRPATPQPAIAILDFTLPLAGRDVARTPTEFAPGRAIAPKLSAVNPDSLAWWASRGATAAWLSDELTLRQISLLAATSPIPLGVIVAGRVELMRSDHCFLMAEGPCERDCKSCPRRAASLEGGRLLSDRKGYRFPVTTDEHGCGHLYNSVATDTAHAVADLLDAGVTTFGIDATCMTDAELADAQTRLENALAGRAVPKKRGATTAHLFRGVE